jgi:hypothetical protein
MKPMDASFPLALPKSDLLVSCLGPDPTSNERTTINRKEPLWGR